MKYKNTKEVTMMIWETNPSKRKQGNLEVKVNVRKEHNLSPGDEICTNLNDKESVWIVKEILNTKPSSLSGYNYVVCICDWKLRSL
ncbi:hypothetical protein [Flavobacterium sp. JP2137]|uniref:hypothetical protein n=1 Tax=Flavobacterium sp. JP2137 TaxID=3414510 RepID=UPI003D2FCA16